MYDKIQFLTNSGKGVLSAKCFKSHQMPHAFFTAVDGLKFTKQRLLRPKASHSPVKQKPNRASSKKIYPVFEYPEKENLSFYLTVPNTFLLTSILYFL